MKSGKPVLYGAYMIACGLLGGVALDEKAYLLLGILLTGGVVFLVLLIKNLIKG